MDQIRIENERKFIVLLNLIESDRKKFNYLGW